MTGGNQLKLSAIVCGTPVGDAIVAAHRARRGRGRHVGRRQHPVQPHAGLRRRRHHAQAADDPDGRRARPAPGHRDRPALRPAQPLRSAADDRGPVAPAARARARRGHRGRRPGRRAERGRPRRGDDPRSRPTSPPTPTTPSAPRRCWPAASCCTCCPTAPASTSPRRSCCPSRPRVDPLEAAEIEEAGHDLRQMARDIAAGDASPSVLRRRLRRTRRARPTLRGGTAGHGTETTMTERPTPDLAILETRVYRGANVWSYEKAIHLVVDLGSLEKFPTNTIPGFTDNLLEMLPGLREHSCSRGKRGGFVERLNEGTWLGHVAEHTALALQQVVGPRHPPRQDPAGQGRAGALQRDLRLRRRAGRARRRAARRTPGQPPRAARPGVRLGRRSSRRSSSGPSGPRSAPRPRRSSTRRSRATSRGSGSTSTPWSSSARASTPSGSAPR